MLAVGREHAHADMTIRTSKIPVYDPEKDKKHKLSRIPIFDWNAETKSTNTKVTISGNMRGAELTAVCTAQGVECKITVDLDVNDLLALEKEIARMHEVKKKRTVEFKPSDIRSDDLDEVIRRVRESGM